MTTRLADQTTGFPYSATTYVQALFPDGTVLSGSGALVGINDVLTASHLIHRDEYGGQAERIVIMPGLDGGVEPYGRHAAFPAVSQALTVSAEGGISPAEGEKDMALLSLGDPVGRSTGWFSLTPDVEGGVFHLAGYPTHLADAQGPRLGEAEDEAWPYDRYELFDLDAFEVVSGSSGGPLWRYDQGVPELTGVVSTEQWASRVAPHYERLLTGMSDNDALMLGEPDEAFSEFESRLSIEGIDVPEAMNGGWEEGAEFLEFRAFSALVDPIVRLYNGVLSRLPDPGGIEHWIAEVNAGRSMPSVAAEMVASPEFQTRLDVFGNSDRAMVEVLYREVLNRSPDAEGLAYWQSSLSSGAISPGELALSISESAEHRELSQASVRASKVELWGVNLELLDMSSLGFEPQDWQSEEERAEAIARLYTGILEREPDKPGFAYWFEVSQEEGVVALAKSLLDSEEFDVTAPLSTDEWLDTLYDQVLGRMPDETGASYWSARLDSGELAIGDVAMGLIESREYMSHSAPEIENFMDDIRHDSGMIGVPTMLEEYLLG